MVAPAFWAADAKAAARWSAGSAIAASYSTLVQKGLSMKLGIEAGVWWGTAWPMRFLWPTSAPAVSHGSRTRSAILILYWTKPGTLSLLLSDTHSLYASDYTAQAPSYMHSCSPAFFGTS